jgi:hypothetical protein
VLASASKEDRNSRWAEVEFSICGVLFASALVFAGGDHGSGICHGRLQIFG